MGVPPIAVAAMAIVIGVAVIIAVTVVVAVIIAAVVTPEKGSGKNPEKSSPRRKERSPSGLLTRNGTRIKVAGILINISSAQKRQRGVKRRAACPLSKDKGRTRTGRKAGPERENRRGK